MDQTTKNDIFETSLLFAVIFLPGYLQFNRTLDIGSFLTLRGNLQYLLQAVPQFLLILYLVYRRGRLSAYGFHRLKLESLLQGILVFILLWLTVIPITILTLFFPALRQVTPMPLLEDFRVLPLLFLLSLSTGYLEEAFFRCYLFNQVLRLGGKPTESLIAVSLLFGLGHLYQGMGAFLATSLMGIVLQLLFNGRYPSIHPIAIGHGLYNFSVFLLMTVRADPMAWIR